MHRRKFIAITAAAAASGLVRAAPVGAASREDVEAHEWRGTWLGAVAAVRIAHPDGDLARRTLGEVAAEARRLEAVFSLYSADSAISSLNRSGVLVAPAAELVDVLRLCDGVHRATGGRFDPTVQPLWQCHAEHYARTGGANGPPPASAIAQALDRVGWGRLRFGRDVVVLERGMALTLNGVAQGYATDRVLDVLRSAGFDHCLVDMGEIRSLGTRGDGRPWQVAVRGAGAELLGIAADETRDRAIATSAADGFAFDAGAERNHLFDPTSGGCAIPGRSLTVVAPTAAEADAFSTAFALMSETEIAAAAARHGGLAVYVAAAGRLREIAAADASRRRPGDRGSAQTALRPSQ